MSAPPPIVPCSGAISINAIKSVIGANANSVNNLEGLVAASFLAERTRSHSFSQFACYQHFSPGDLDILPLTQSPGEVDTEITVTVTFQLDFTPNFPVAITWFYQYFDLSLNQYNSPFYYLTIPSGSTSVSTTINAQRHESDQELVIYIESASHDVPIGISGQYTIIPGTDVQVEVQMDLLNGGIISDSTYELYTYFVVNKAPITDITIDYIVTDFDGANLFYQVILPAGHTSVQVIRHVTRLYNDWYCIFELIGSNGAVMGANYTQTATVTASSTQGNMYFEQGRRDGYTAYSSGYPYDDTAMDLMYYGINLDDYKYGYSIGYYS